MNHLVKIIRDDDGYLTGNDTWHLVDPAQGVGPAALCTGEFFGPGESKCEYEEKKAKTGGITCPECLEKLQIYKSVRL